MISTFQDIWIYEKKSQNVFKLSLGATLKAQLVGKEGSYYIVIEDTEHRPFSDHL